MSGQNIPSTTAGTSSTDDQETPRAFAQYHLGAIESARKRHQKSHKRAAKEPESGL